MNFAFEIFTSRKNIKIVIQLVENFQLWKILTVKGKIVWT